MSQAKERPILFSGPMVRAILEGRKTVTRRPVKGGQIPRLEYPDSAEPWVAVGQHHPRYGFIVHGKTEQECAVKVGELGACPFGEPGDRLWVREAWAADAQLDGIAPRDLSQGEPIMYPADGSVRQTGCAMISQGRGRPSIHMPRWASRILLEITAVRVERLQDISEDQAEAEGVGFLRHVPDADETLTAAQLFECLWSSINGDESWTSNPWVWVVEFKAIDPDAAGCDYHGSHFGAPYPDAQCVDGFLWDEDSCDVPGGPLLSGGDIPCPKCNAEAYTEHQREANQ
ncbi:hypothetical protein E4195_01260 [Pseudomonas putida]|nr:hypothetical protein [Pseudomonas putida]TFW40119.1 hypothetical protein E4195_01260 [Pseudomonas putida]